jgi:putative transposase
MPTLSHGSPSSAVRPSLRPAQLALSHYLPSAQLDALVQATGCRYRRRVFDPGQVLWAGVDQALGGQLSQSAVVSRLAAVSGRALDRDSGALCRARQRCPASLARAAAQQVARRAQLPGPRCWLIDGSSIVLPDSTVNQARYPQSRSQEPGLGQPQIHFVALLDLDTGCLGHLALGTLYDHDAKLGRALWDVLAPGDLLIADRGFASYGLLVGAARRGFGVVVRQHQRRLNSDPLATGVDDRQETWSRPKRPAPWWDADLPQHLTVRVVRCRLDDGSVLTLNTNLPAEHYPAQVVLDLYQQRWRVETRFLELKVSLGADQLRAATPDLAESSLWQCILAFNLVQSLLTEAARQAGLERYRLSFGGAVEALAAAALLPTTDAAEACNWVLAEVIRNPLPRRQNPCRDEPRALRRHHRAYPWLTKPRDQYPRGRRTAARE